MNNKTRQNTIHFCHLSSGWCIVKHLLLCKKSIFIMHSLFLSHFQKVYIIFKRWRIKPLIHIGCTLQCVPLKGKHNVQNLQTASDLLRDTVLQPQMLQLLVALWAQVQRVSTATHRKTSQLESRNCICHQY